MDRRVVLLLGSGGREHALARALQRSPSVATVIVAPGNGGIDEAGGTLRRVAVDIADVNAIVALAQREKPDLVVIGPEAPLVAGAVDALTAQGFTTFGPSRAAARLEGSKAFLKDFAVRHGIPTARHRTVRSFAEAEAEIDARGAPLVVKADGLCAGKGVVVATTVDEAKRAARVMLVDRVFGDAGACVILEECIEGRELSVHAICDGERSFVLPPARDHKRIFDGDRGPNTGGMGVICPAPDADPALVERITRELILPTVRGMREDGAPFRGVLFAGVMVRPDGTPFLLEHNVRFGDPECEALMEILDGDIAALFDSAARGKLDLKTVSVRENRSAVVVVLAAAGYPESPVLGARIDGIGAAEALGAVVHHAGTRRDAEGVLRVAGGRVLAVTASGPSLVEARTLAYRAADAITFEGKQLRRDIGTA